MELKKSYLLTIAGLAAVYYGTATLGLQLSVAYSIATPVWAPTGISLAAVLIFGYRVWPGIALGAFLANMSTDAPVMVAAATAFGNTLEALVGAYLLSRVADFRTTMRRVSDVLAFVGLAAFVSPVVSATVGSTALVAAGEIGSDEYGVVWGIWWFGDVMGALLVAPFLLVLSNTRWRLQFRERARVIEFLALLVSVGALGTLVFLSGELSHPAVLFPLFVWGALRFTQLGVVVTSLVVTILAVWGTLSGLFVVRGASETGGVLLTELQLGTIAVSALVLAAAMAERERAQETIRTEARSLYLLERISAAANEAESIEGALKTAVDEICEYTGWPVGHAYMVSPDDQELMIPADIWHLDSPDRFANFKASTESMSVMKGEGIPGRILESKHPLWVSDVMQDTNFPRARVALDLGVHAAFAFPILLGRDVVGVLEFFSARIEEPDKTLLDLMAHVGAQVGRVIERQQSGEALSLSEERSRLIVETANDAFIAIDRDSKIIDWNRVAERMFGWSREEVVGTSMPELIMPEQYRNDHYRGVARFLDTGEGPVFYEQIELSALKRDGNEFPVELTIWPLEVGDSYQFNAFVRDVSARKRLEGYRDQFIANAAHELRTPVATITGLLDLLKERSRLKREDVDSAMTAITRQGHRLGILIRNLLDLTRLEQGNLEVDVQPVALAAAVRSALEAAPPPEGKKVEEDLRRDLIVSSDPTRLEQIVTNLLTNAYRYGGDEIRIVSDAGAGGVVLSVEDNGEGVPVDIVPQLFDPFTRGRNSSGTGGSGLGLAIVQMLAEACGANVTYAAREPSGSRFELHLPAA